MTLSHFSHLPGPRPVLSALLVLSGQSGHRWGPILQMQPQRLREASEGAVSEWPCREPTACLAWVLAPSPTPSQTAPQVTAVVPTHHGTHAANRQPHGLVHGGQEALWAAVGEETQASLLQGG